MKHAGIGCGTLLALLLAVAGCPEVALNDNNTGGQPAEPTARVNTRPTADAGLPQTVRPGELVVLDGTGSFDPDGDRLTFFWRAVTLRPEVFLQDAFSSRPRFIAPAVESETSFVFQLTVADGFSIATAEVTVIVQP